MRGMPFSKPPDGLDFCYRKLLFLERRPVAYVAYQMGELVRSEKYPTHLPFYSGRSLLGLEIKLLGVIEIIYHNLVSQTACQEAPACFIKLSTYRSASHPEAMWFYGNSK